MRIPRKRLSKHFLKTAMAPHKKQRSKIFKCNVDINRTSSHFSFKRRLLELKMFLEGIRSRLTPNTQSCSVSFAKQLIPYCNLRTWLIYILIYKTQMHYEVQLYKNHVNLKITKNITVNITLTYTINKQVNYTIRSTYLNVFSTIVL